MIEVLVVCVNEEWFLCNCRSVWEREREVAECLLGRSEFREGIIQWLVGYLYSIDFCSSLVTFSRRNRNKNIKEMYLVVKTNIVI
jgi:hypothetical protein